jgi:hypothetical protein
MKRTPQTSTKFDRTERSGGARVSQLGNRRERPDWLTQELQRQYRDVLEEPVPDELLAILRDSPEETEAEESRTTDETPDEAAGADTEKSDRGRD